MVALSPLTAEAQTLAEEEREKHSASKEGTWQELGMESKPQSSGP